MWKGCAPTVMRAVVLNAAQLSTYAQGKQLLLKTPYFEEGTATHLVASLISGFISTAVSIPIDMSKTRIQTMKNNEYKNAMDVIVKVVKNEGPLALWKGFTPYFLRLGPHTVVCFIFQFFSNG
jgi:solute carrier family 25 oxoglutarate transporter 11